MTWRSPVTLLCIAFGYGLGETSVPIQEQQEVAAERGQLVQ